MKTFLFAFLLTAVWLFCPQSAQASFGTPYAQCFGVNTGISTTTACTGGGTCVSAGDLQFTVVNNYGNGTSITTTFSDNVDGAWSQALTFGNPYYQQTYVYMIASTSACRTYTATVSPGSTAILTDFSVWAVHGNFPTLGGVLDCAPAGTTFTSAGVTPRLTGNCVTTYTNDLIVSGIACNSTSAAEFSVSAGWTNLNTSNTVPATSFRVEYQTLSAAGTYQGSFTDTFGGPCVFSGGLYGVQGVMAFKSATGAPGSPTQPWIINMKYHPRKKEVYRDPTIRTFHIE